MSIKKWRGTFGDEYHERNDLNAGEIKNRETLLRKILSRGYTGVLDQVLEVGAGNGVNLYALGAIDSQTMFTAIEPNRKACEELQASGLVDRAYNLDIRNLDREFKEAHFGKYDLVFTYGVLIHIESKYLNIAMTNIYDLSKKYILSVEYFAPKEEKIEYREGVFCAKRDYGSIWMDRFNVKLINHGFAWKRTTGLDNVTWWLFEKG